MCTPGPLPLQIFTKRIKEGVWDITAIVDSGGMPSSHSALCTVRCPWHGRFAATVLHARLHWVNGSCIAVTQLPMLAALQAVTTAVGHKLGVGSSLFAVSLAFTLVVMYDAANVRWHAGKRNAVMTVMQRPELGYALVAMLSSVGPVAHGTRQFCSVPWCSHAGSETFCC